MSLQHRAIITLTNAIVLCNTMATLHAELAASHYLIVTLTMTMSSCGLSVRLFVLAFEMFCTTSIPFVTLPNTVCLLSSHGCQTDTVEKHLHQTHDKISLIKLLQQNIETKGLGGKWSFSAHISGRIWVGRINKRTWTLCNSAVIIINIACSLHIKCMLLVSIAQYSCASFIVLLAVYH